MIKAKQLQGIEKKINRWRLEYIKWFKRYGEDWKLLKDIGEDKFVALDKPIPPPPPPPPELP